MTEMSEEMPAAPGGTERKVKLASIATFVVALVGTVALESTVTDMVPALPDWLEAPAYSLILALVTWGTGYQTRNRPESISQSSVDAVKAWLRKRAPRV